MIYRKWTNDKLTFPSHRNNRATLPIRSIREKSPDAMLFGSSRINLQPNQVVVVYRRMWRHWSQSVRYAALSARCDNMAASYHLTAHSPAHAITPPPPLPPTHTFVSRHIR